MNDTATLKPMRRPITDADPRKQAAYQVEWRRKKSHARQEQRAAEQADALGDPKKSNLEPMNPTLTPPLEVRLRSAENLLEALERAMGEVLACDSDTIARAKTVGYLVERASALIKITDLVEKVTALQKVVDGEAAKDWKDASY